MNKKIVLGVVVLVIFLGLGYLYNQKNEEFKLITNDEELAEFMKDMEEGDVEEYLAKKDQLYAQDIYGGATPEETLDLYIEALKVGDLELASKYFRLEDQENELIELKKMGAVDIDEYVSVLNTHGGSFCSETFGWCEINGVFNNMEVSLAKFILNEQTNKWKMESIKN
ncbi:TPA: hypothetical protein DCZ46_01845 [Candidatus Campbellbacteria bacterium]|nr:MAG: seg [Candidatus Campbellbacteria bacterium GW2011_OD1_34_28]KKP75178.1 MAG: hypothetical protein UR74_C0001G0034 [Candidatus Campbellbacteria bacterium GW2011_GWD2_35_24]KKP76261.1 MAG: hypothetical protein UR75_C0001G0295 [Candidatus Campbellbacteria bacterium GW2011_GWC2_35_28]KKP77450.1 MAG: hypothetical protein UR76_C0001G0295 [Candidatus Campbellbacteria bacterium GW2011_GWC1_35_31]KKP79379.1 MAG: hypothetical protein UR79_C0001G0295 [Candidatus Campbellbacteria bacterium GW2011_GW